MNGIPSNQLTIAGLSTHEADERLKQYGKNELSSAGPNRFLIILKSVFTEPMFILLVVACSLYFILGSISEGIMMLVAMALVTAISIYQEVRSSAALENLRQYTAPGVTVIRDGREQNILSALLVPGDIILLEEGMLVPADAQALTANDLSANESVITGESMPVDKSEKDGQNKLFQGSTINSGKCTAVVTETGNRTELGKIGRAITGYESPKTLLQVQTSGFVRKLALFGILAFVVIFIINYTHYGNWVTSLLFALTLAMSAVPEEIPVAFSSFMALGAYKMSKLGIISRQPQVIENLGAMSVLCVDKTGTITENRMEVKVVYDFLTNSLNEISATQVSRIEDVLYHGVLASEKNPFDPMEKAIVEAFQSISTDRSLFDLPMIFEYPLGGRPPMMTHVYERNGEVIVAGKGAPEKLMELGRLTEQEQEQVSIQIKSLAAKGYRILGVGHVKNHTGEMPAGQEEFNWIFDGLIALYDPPKKGIGEIIKSINAANIDVKMLTGDYPETAVNIAGQVGIPVNQVLRGDEIVHMSAEELRNRVNDTSIFARMFPEAKVRVIQALKANNEIVAMIGDGVNDGPAIKVSDIGITLGRKGTETAKGAADLVITDDDLGRVVAAVSEGRRIYFNLVKAIRYIISIHIPIILTASLPLILGWKFPNIFTPIHVIFLELIMGPTCSIFFEREPVEKNVMQMEPRKRQSGLFRGNQLMISIIQGLMITAGVLVLYKWYMDDGHSIEVTRTMVFTTLIIANVFLTFSGRSVTNSIFYTSRFENSLSPVIIGVSVLFLILLHTLKPVRDLFHLTPVGITDFMICLGVAFVSVAWFEVYKLMWRKRKLGVSSRESGEEIRNFEGS